MQQQSKPITCCNMNHLLRFTTMICVNDAVQRLSGALTCSTLEQAMALKLW